MEDNPNLIPENNDENKENMQPNENVSKIQKMQKILQEKRLNKKKGGH